MQSIGTMACHLAHIYIWNTKVGSEDGDGTTTGHVSMELVKSNNKSSSERKYLSLRPKYPWLVNPLTIFIPSVGQNYTSLEEDCEHESKMPDRIISLKISKEQYKAMKEKINEMDTAIQNEELLYHLFPGTSLLFVAQGMAKKRPYEVMTECPFSGLSIENGRHRDMAGMSRLRASHCALAVREVLRMAKINIPICHWSPWKITPSELGDVIRDGNKQDFGK